MNKNTKSLSLSIISYITITIFSVMCIFPFLLVITSSFMEEEEILTEGFKLIPDTFTTAAYEFLFAAPEALIDAYWITFITTVVGTVLGLIFMSMAGYVLNSKNFKYRNFFSFFIYFTTLFSGGLIPSYILMVKYLNLKDNIWSLILPMMVSAWSIFLMRNFMKSIPDSLAESAKIDGAGEFRIYAQIYMPLAIPSLATVGLFLALSYWNQWYNAMLYIESSDMWTLQYLLQKMVNQTNVDILISQGVQVDAGDAPTQAVKMATAILATGPIVLLYPFLQKFFVGGLTVGSVKG